MINSRALLIAIEGIDGSGKSSLAYALHQQLQTLGFNTLLTKEPGGTGLGQQLRGILQTTQSLTPKVEFLLFAADRAQHIKEVIKPGLEKYQVIISDRMSASSIAYQGFGRGLEIPVLQTINEWTMEGIKPDITFYLSIEAQEAMKRIKQRGKPLTVFESDPLFIERVINGFDQLSQQKGWITLDAQKSTDQLTTQASEMIMQWIQQ